MRVIKGLEGKVAIVTGASRGIGKAIALGLANAGVKVVVAARTIEETARIGGSIIKTAEEIKERGGWALPVQTNIADESSVESMVQKALSEAGRIDFLINDAGISVRKPFKDLTLKEWDLVVRVNLRGFVACTKSVLPVMIEQRCGHIVNISSIAAIAINYPITGLVYDVSKAAINRFTWGLAEELKGYNIAVNALMPENTKSDGWMMINPEIDKSGWQTTDLWSDNVIFLVTRNPGIFSGKTLTAKDIEREIEATGWERKSVYLERP
jgi:citronellol/citronellal dehydrogenase